MSKVTAPLLSFEAHGQIAKTQVYGSWKGIPYARRYVIPANPQSTEQTLTRDTFKFLNSVYKIAPALARAPWARYAIGKPLTDRNAFLKFNNGPLRTAASLVNMWLSPGAFGGLAAPFTLTGGALQITVEAATPAPLPAGWTIVSFNAVAIKEQDPQSGTAFEMFAAEDLTAAYSIVLTGLAAATSYAVAGFFKYQRSALASDVAYGPAQAALVSTT